MGLPEVLLTGAGLSMDAVAVAMTNAMVYRNCRGAAWRMLLMPLLFGAFQALMPALGYFAGGLVAGFLSRYAGYVAFGILSIIGGMMVFEGVRERKTRCEASAVPALSVCVLLVQAVATSVDALAVGVGFSAMRLAIFPVVLTIGLTTGTLSAAAIGVGKCCGNMLGWMAQVAGGLILIAIGIRALF